MASRADIEAGRAFVRLYLKNDMSRQLVRALKAAQDKLRSFGQSAVSIGRNLAMAGTAISAPFALSVRTFAAFEDQMKAVQAVTGATGDEFQRLYDLAKKLGRTTSFTAGEVGGAQLNLGRAGFKPKEIEASIDSVLNLARATGTDLPQSAEIASGTLRAFNLDASEMGRVADVMTATANNSAQTLEELGESMKYAAPVAQEFGMSLEQTSKAIGVMANMQIKGSMAGTSLRMVMLQASDPKIAKRIREVAGQEALAALQAGRLGDAMQLIGQAMGNMSSLERIALGKELFGARAVSGALKLARSDFPALSAAIDNAAGTAKRTADVMDSGLGGAFRILRSAVEGVQIAIGEALTPALTKIAKYLTTAAGAAVEWIKNNKDAVIAMAATGAGLIAAGAALIGIGLAAQVAAFGIGGLATAVGVLTSPLGLLLAALTAGAVAWVKFSDSGQQAWTSLKAAVMPIIETIKASFGGIKDALMSGDWELAGRIAIAGLKLALLQGLTGIQNAFPKTFRTVLIGVGKILDGLVKLFGKAMGLLKNQWNAWGKKVLETVLAVSGKIVSVWQKTVSGMANWMLETSAKGGAMGKAMSAILGVDVAEEQKRAEELEKKLAKIQGRKPGKVDVLSDARADVKKLTEQWEAEAKANLAAAGKAADEFMKGLPDNIATDMAGAIDRFIKGLESGKSVEEAQKELAGLRSEAAKRREEADKKQKEVGEKPVAQPGAPAAVAAMSTSRQTAPRGVALTATYSAAAARISGYQPTGPEEKVAAGVTETAANTKQIVSALVSLATKADEQNSQMSQFLAGWAVS